MLMLYNLSLIPLVIQAGKKGGDIVSTYIVVKN